MASIKKKAKRKIATNFTVIIIDGAMCACTPASFVSPLYEETRNKIHLYILSILDKKVIYLGHLGGQVSILSPKPLL